MARKQKRIGDLRKPTFSLLLIVISILLISCSDRDQAADEIVKYYNEEWIPINNSIKDELGTFTTEFIKLDSQKDKSEAIQLLKTEIIPLVEEIITKLENVEPTNKKIKKMNKLQLKAERFFLESNHDIIKHYKGELSESELAKKKKKLDSMYDDVLKYQQKVFKKFNLKLSDEKVGSYSKLEKEE